MAVLDELCTEHPDTETPWDFREKKKPTRTPDEEKEKKIEVVIISRFTDRLIVTMDGTKYTSLNHLSPDGGCDE